MTSDDEKCPDCKGTGEYTGFTAVEPCELCCGTGIIDALDEDDDQRDGVPIPIIDDDDTVPLFTQRS